LREVLDPRVRVDSRPLACGVRTCTADAVDVSQPDPHVLVHRDIDAGYACHVYYRGEKRCILTEIVAIHYRQTKAVPLAILAAGAPARPSVGRAFGRIDDTLSVVDEGTALTPAAACGADPSRSRRPRAGGARS